MSLQGKGILVTGGARRVGRALALAVAHAGATTIIHYGQSQDEATVLEAEIKALGGDAITIQADLNDSAQVSSVIDRVWELQPVFGLVNSAAIFEPFSFETTSLQIWEQHMCINLTAPFLLSQAFARRLPEEAQGRIVNILDWRALRPGADHFAYTISKAGLAAMTKSLAVALAPRITVNGLALGAVLPPSDGGSNPDLLKSVPAARWADLDEVGKSLLFLLEGPAYITGEIIHVDGGRHLV